MWNLDSQGMSFITATSEPANVIMPMITDRKATMS